ncbi:hypothetical protein SDC9_205666 [bioreactor metagenome]|uniref:Uncharacterized protein n=1 Tax=bioreactor metagenome TaxID=1076179 RepID=A0A645J4B1_9ZZZZ
MHDDFTVEALVFEPEEGNAARLVDGLDQRAGEVFVAADGLDEHVFAGFHGAGKVDQSIGQLENSRIKHRVPPHIENVWMILWWRRLFRRRVYYRIKQRKTPAYSFFSAQETIAFRGNGADSHKRCKHH